MAGRKAQIIALSAGQVVGQVISLSIAMVMTRALGKVEFAAYRQTLLAYGTAVPFFGLGIAQSVYYFLPKEQSRIRGRILDSATLLLLSGATLTTFIVLGGNELLANRFQNAQVSFMVLMMAPCALVSLPASLVTCVLVARGLSFKASAISVSGQLGVGLCTLCGLVIFVSAKAALTGFVIGTVLSGTISFWFMYRMLPKDPATVCFTEMGRTLKFSVPIGASFMIGHLAMQMGALLISFTSTPQVYAIFAVGAQELPLQVITSSITSVILADMSLHFSRKESQQASRLWAAAAEKSSMFLIPAFTFLFVFAEDYITILFSKDYAASIPVFQVFLLLVPLRAFYFGSILIAAGESRFILVRTAIWALIVLFGGVVAFHFFGIVGVAWVIVLSQYLFAAPVNFARISQITGQPWKELIPFRTITRIAAASLIPLVVTIPARASVEGAPGAALAGTIYGTGLIVTFIGFGLISPLAISRSFRRHLAGGTP